MSLLFNGQPAAFREALQSDVAKTALCLELDFRSGVERMSDWNVPFLDANGNEWKPYRGLVSISPIEGSRSSTVVEFGLGIPWDFLGDDLQPLEARGLLLEKIGDMSDYAERVAKLSIQYFSRDAKDAFGRPVPVGSPFALCVLAMASVRASFSETRAELILTCESFLARAGAPVHSYLTDRDQQRRSLGDNGLRYVAEVTSTSQIWTTWD